jgi:hypothetical protein
MVLKYVPIGSKGRGPRHLAAVIAIGTFGVVLAACSSSAGSASTTSTTAPAGSKGTASTSFAAYTKCLSEHGVTLPSFKGSRPSGTGGPEGRFTPGSGGPPGGGAGTPGSGSFPGRGAGGFASNPKDAAAEKACASLRPKGGFGGGFGRGTNRAAFAAYTNCLKLHGVTVSNGVPDRSSAAFATASTACAALRPKPGSTTSTTAPATAG